MREGCFRNQGGGIICRQAEEVQTDTCLPAGDRHTETFLHKCWTEGPKWLPCLSVHHPCSVMQSCQLKMNSRARQVMPTAQKVVSGRSWGTQVREASGSLPRTKAWCCRQSLCCTILPLHAMAEPFLTPLGLWCLCSLHHRFAAIKAAICSPTSSSSSSSSKESKPARSPQPQQPPADASSSSPVLPPTHGPSAAPDDMGTPPAATHTTSQHCSTPCSPPTRSPGSRSDPPAGTEGPRSSSSDLATAVAAALSPRATAAQAEVLAGLFGGRSPSGRLHRSLNGAMGSSSSMDWGEGGVGGAVCVLKPPCARRVTWSAADEPCGAGPSAAGVVSGGGRLLGKACGASILEPPAHKVRHRHTHTATIIHLFRAFIQLRALLSVLAAASIAECSPIVVWS